jgi:formamidopyrimidine-DNA glycosylase
MIEVPETSTISKQLNLTIKGKRIAGVTVGHTPHKLAWYYGNRDDYSFLLSGKTIAKASAYGSLVEINVGLVDILLGEGVGIRFHAAGEAVPPKHQFMVEFEDHSAITACVQMYGGMGCFVRGELENKYYKVAKEKPSPLTSKFSESYFQKMSSLDEVQNLSLKALLATEQRIPGLGNGTLQDILFNARLHPKRKTRTLSDKDRINLFNAVKSTLASMEIKGGRDTEIDLFGAPGGYRTILSKKTLNGPCPNCGMPIRKEAYMGGAIYFCAKCQV